MSTKALIVVDIQNEYFPQGKLSLVGINEAADNAALVIASAREKGHTVIHVRHEMPSADAPIFTPGTDGVEINEKVKPIEGEAVVVKHYPNSFRETSLKDLLDKENIKDVTVIGAMSHMCIDTTVRTAKRLDYDVGLLGDACTTKALVWDNETIPAEIVHSAFMASLQGTFAKVIETRSLEDI